MRPASRRASRAASPVAARAAITVASRTPSVPPRAAARLATPLRALVRATLAIDEREPGEIAIVLGDDALLRDLNRRWRGIDRSTDVLSFSYDECLDEGPIGGDLAISMDRARAQAKRYRVSLGSELARLVVHGTLHLAGHDHQRAGERLRMRRHERLARASCATWMRVLERVLAPS